MRVLYCRIIDKISGDNFYSYVAVMEDKEEDKILEQSVDGNISAGMEIDNVLEKEFGLSDNDIQYYFTSKDKAFEDNHHASNDEYDYYITK